MSINRIDDTASEFDPEIETELFAYDDIVTTFADGHFNLTVDQTVGSDLPDDGNSVNGLHIAPVLNGRLEDNQVAELFAIELNSASVWLDEEADQEQAGSGRVEYQVNVPNQKHQQSYNFTSAAGEIDQNMGNIGDANEEDFGGDTGAFSRTYAGSATGLLYVTLPWTASFHDTSPSGAGGAGAVTTAGPYVKNFRHLFGRGPVVDPGDEFQIGLGVEWNKNPDVSIKGEIKVSAHYDVYEQPQGDYRDVRGLGE